MKIAYILYGSFSSLDFASIYDPISYLQKMYPQNNLVWDLCASNEHIYNDQGWPFSPTRVNCNLSDYDIAVIPGCMDVDKLIKNEAFLDWLQNLRNTPLIVAIGKGALLLAAAGLLDNKKIAVSPDNLVKFKLFATTPVVKDIIRDNGIITVAGSSSTLAAGLLLCSEIAPMDQVNEVKKYIGIVPASNNSEKMAEEQEPQENESKSGMRTSKVDRKSKETDIHITLDIDGDGKHTINTGVPFFDHMLTQIAVHGLFDLDINTKGDLEIDPHHTIEDVGLALGQAFQEALGDRAGIYRMASFSCPMDESLANVVIDFSGRSYAIVRMDHITPIVGGIPAHLFTHFFESFAIQARCNLHISVPYGKDGHHQVEAAFKALARAMDMATRIDPRRGRKIPSSKGVLY